MWYRYMKLALQGHTIVVSSGDYGVTSPPNRNENGKQDCFGPSNKTFVSSWPVSCPYVTAVGATRFWPGQKVFEPQSVAEFARSENDSKYESSSGGFSSDIAAPMYQREAISRWIPSQPILFINTFYQL